MLAALGAAGCEEAPHCATLCELRLRQVLPAAEDVVYFPISGCIALLSEVEGGPGPEVGLVGAEGMLGWQAMVPRSHVPWYAMVCSAGRAWRVDAAWLREMQLRSAQLRGVIHGQWYLALALAVSSAACMRLHSIEQRLARRLLTHADCAGHGHMDITHAMLASLLGVRRVGITRVAGAMAREGLIVYRHGELRLLDRQGLMERVCPCYAAQRGLREGLDLSPPGPC